MTLQTFAEHRCSAILRTPHENAVQPAMEAAIEGGFRVVEFTLTTPGALRELARFALRNDIVVGAGTVLTVADARGAIDAGARFLVSPVVDPEVIGFARDHGIIAVPGAATPSEVLRAHRAGADMVKIFPGPPGGADWIRAVRGPLPFVRLFPTSGVTLDNCADYLAAGSFGVGFVNCLFDPGDIGAGRFDAIAARARQMVAAVAAAPRPTAGP